MKTKFMIVASLGALFALPSQADPIRAGISIGRRNKHYKQSKM